MHIFVKIWFIKKFSPQVVIQRSVIQVSTKSIMSSYLVTITLIVVLFQFRWAPWWRSVHRRTDRNCWSCWCWQVSGNVQHRTWYLSLNRKGCCSHLQLYSHIAVRKKIQIMIIIVLKRNITSIWVKVTARSIVSLWPALCHEVFFDLQISTN